MSTTSAIKKQVTTTESRVRGLHRLASTSLTRKRARELEHRMERLDKHLEEKLYEYSDRLQSVFIQRDHIQELLHEVDEISAYTKAALERFQQQKQNLSKIRQHVITTSARHIALGNNRKINNTNTNVISLNI